MPTTDWLYVGIFLLIAPVFPAVALLIPRVIAPRKPNPIKMQTYECGIETVGASWIQFKVQYYIFALVFLIFDVEGAYIFTWAVVYEDTGWPGLVRMSFFIILLLVGLFYIWKHGGLDWRATYKEE